MRISAGLKEATQGRTGCLDRSVLIFSDRIDLFDWAKGALDSPAGAAALLFCSF